MKLVIQIPAWDEAEQIGPALAELPRSVAGLRRRSRRSSWTTARPTAPPRPRGARERDHVVRLPIHRGLAFAWRAGLDAALRLGADVIVSTDADRQYAAADVEALVAPLLRGEAEIVVGDRGVATKADFSPGKRLTQRFGSWVVRRASGTDVPDATSGFRALTREAALRLNVFSKMTYTLETLIQAGNKEMAVASVPVRTNPPVRASRLIRRTSNYVLVQGANILRITALYKPLPVFFGCAALLALLGLGLVGRYVFFVITDHNPAGHLQSLLLAAVLFVAAVVSVLSGLLADLISINRTLLEELVVEQRRKAFGGEREISAEEQMNRERARSSGATAASEFLRR